MRHQVRAFTALGAALVALVAFGLPASSATSAPGFAPVDRPGPALSVAPSALAASLSCSGDLRSGTEPVLLVPGTTQDPATNFSWNYEKGFTQQRRPWCSVALPDRGMADVQVAGEYVVHAIRTLHERSGQKVEVVGYSQGGMLPRWALRFWPDTRSLVDDVVAIDPSNHGTLDANALCTLTCAPSIWQQQAGSHFLAALNSGQQTFAGIDYTVVYSNTDEVVVPNAGPAALSPLPPGPGRIANIAAQSICPLDVSEHLAMGTYDPVAYAVVQDALNHAGPAVAARIPRSICLSPLSPPVDPLTFPAHMAQVVALAGDELATYPHTSAEPPLAPYVYR
jgi:hypothetical protein